MKKLYRGGGFQKMPYNLTATDIINYEINELGNDITVVSGIDTDIITSERLLWLAETRKYASEFGQVDEFTGNYRILAKDTMGGLLIETLKLI